MSDGSGVNFGKLISRKTQIRKDLVKCLFSDEAAYSCGDDPWAGTRQTQPEEPEAGK